MWSPRRTDKPCENVGNPIGFTKVLENAKKTVLSYHRKWPRPAKFDEFLTGRGLFGAI